MSDAEPIKEPTAPAVGFYHATRYTDISPAAKSLAERIVSESRRALSPLTHPAVGAPAVATANRAIAELRNMLVALALELPPTPPPPEKP